MLKEFKEFALKGNVMDMAIGIVIGAAFGPIIKSLVDDIIMPPIGLLLGKVDFANMYVLLKQGAAVAAPYASLADAKAAGAVTMNLGLFINYVISFIIVAFVVFLIVKGMNRMRRQSAPAAPTTKDCPHCFTAIPIKATRCPHCTSQVG
jgi:large conductance mechanosensitive channel